MNNMIRTIILVYFTIGIRSRKCVYLDLDHPTSGTKCSSFDSKFCDTAVETVSWGNWKVSMQWTDVNRRLRRMRGSYGRLWRHLEEGMVMVEGERYVK